MSDVTIRNLPGATYRALKARAARHDRSTDAEIRDILETAVRPETRLRLGSTLADNSLRLGLTNQDIDALDHIRTEVQAEDAILSALLCSPLVGADVTPTLATPRKPVDATLLKSMTESVPPQTQTATNLVRLIRDSDRF